MRYEVPQFIEVEDKIFGPLTARQFVYLAGGGGACLGLFTVLPVFFAIVLSIPVMALAGALAFYEVNGRPLIQTIENAFGYLVGKKLYLWNAERRREVLEIAQSAPKKEGGLLVPKLSESKLKDLAWSLNIKDAEREVQDSDTV